jgi:hypothetical protein
MELIFVVISFLLVSLAMVTIVYLFLKRQHDHSLVKLQTELALQRQNYFLPSKLEAYQRCIAQQLFVSPQGWTMLIQAKEEVLRVINMAANTLDAQASATDLASRILEISAQIEQFPTEICRSYLQNEFQRFNA